MRFHVGAPGMTLDTFGGRRKAFRFGAKKINLRKRGRENAPKAHLPVPGAPDLCVIADDRPLDDVIDALHARGVAIIEEPVARTGAGGPLRSVHLPDPDLNLIEISEIVA